MKKLSKRLLSLFISLLMLLSMGIVALAENEEPPTTDPVMTLTAATQTVQADSEVTISFNLTDNAGFNEFMLYVEYDAAVLTAKSVAKGGMFSGISFLSVKNSGFVVCRVNKLAENITANGTMFSIVFTVANASAVSDIKLSLRTEGYFKNAAGESVTVSFVDGKVTVQQYATISLSSAEVQEGDDFTISATATRNPGIKFFRLYINFDYTKISVKSIVKGSAMTSGTLQHTNIDSANTSGVLLLLFTGTQALTAANAELFKVGFGSKSGVGDCNLALTLSEGSSGYVKDASGSKIGFNPINGAVKLYEYIPVFNFSLSRLDEVADNEVATALVEIDDNPGFTYFLFKIKYDASILTPQSVVTFKRDSEGNAIDLELANLGTLKTNLSSANGELIISWEKTDATKDFKRDGELIAIMFMVKDDAPDGKLNLTFDKNYGLFNNAKGQNCKAEFTDGYFNIVNASTGWWQQLLLFWDDLVALFSDQMSLALFVAKWFNF